MVSGGNNETEVIHLKNKAKKYLKKECFYYINDIQIIPVWKNVTVTKNNAKLLYAKQELGSKSSETDLLGIHWNEATDSFEVRFPPERYKLAKRYILRKLA